MEVTCDNCSRKFQIKMKKQNHGLEIKEHYFQCPNLKCKKRYTSFVTNQEARKLQKEIRALSAELPGHAATSSPEEYRQKVDEVDAKQKELTGLMNRLKAEIKSKGNDSEKRIPFLVEK